ncbi:Zinc finger protein klf1 [Spathaspora sp. JA1]|nr:Zinc finger protein klf1 [Spathaspora sp. JA1]
MSFICSTCYKGFTRKEYLYRHEKNHQNIRPFECKECNLTFTRSDLFSKHCKSKSHRRKWRERASPINSTYEPSYEPSRRIPPLSSPSTSTNSGVSLLRPSINKSVRLGISRSLNSIASLPAPPRQPSIILPSISGSAASKREEYRLVPIGISEKRTTPSETFMQSLLPNSAPFHPSDDKNLFWFFNDVAPMDNMNWLFSDLASVNEDLFHSPVGIPKDIPTSMYQNLYNEDTTSAFNNNKIFITEETRSKIIELFPLDHLRQTSLERFEEYLDLYWFNFAQTFPIIHQATFDPNALNIYLLVSIIVIGMAHSLDKIEYETSIALNKKFRRIIYDVIEDKTELPLPLIQALLLHNFSAKNFGDSGLCKIAQIDHGANIMYMKFTGLLENLTEPMVNRAAVGEELTNQWRNWIHYESCKRAVFFEFICDTQHATFSKLELLTAFDIKLELPCTDEVWNCTDALKFINEYQKQPKGLLSRPRFLHERNGYSNSNSFNGGSEETESVRSVKPVQVSTWPTFLWSLKSMMHSKDEMEYSLDCYSLFSRYIILHGLLRICYDMRGQNLFDLGIVSNQKLSEYFSRLEKGFLTWKDYFDLHVQLYEKQVKSKGENQTHSSNLILTLNDYGPTNASWANVSFYYTGLFCLYGDIPAIKIFASEYKTFTSGNIQGLKEIEHHRNDLMIDQWAKSIYGEVALVEACMFLRLVHNNEETINTFSHVPQTAHMAALIIWCREMKRVKLAMTANLKYFHSNGDIDYELTRKDAFEYISNILSKEMREDENIWEKERQMGTWSVVCYVLHLLRNCKWRYCIELVQQLEHVVSTYPI